jgi:hypothetical protein
MRGTKIVEKKKRVSPPKTGKQFFSSKIGVDHQILHP